MGACLPPGMQAIGGPGNGVFEISEDLVGFQYLAYMLADDPELFADLFRRIGDLMVESGRPFLSATVSTTPFAALATTSASAATPCWRRRRSASTSCRSIGG